MQRENLNIDNVHFRTYVAFAILEAPICIRCNLDSAKAGVISFESRSFKADISESRYGIITDRRKYLILLFAGGLLQLISFLIIRGSIMSSPKSSETTRGIQQVPSLTA